MTKMSISQAWDETRAILGRDGKLIASVALALLVLPGVLLGLFLPTSENGAVPAPGIWIAIVIVALVVSFVGQLSIVRLAMRPHVTVGNAIKHGARRTLPFILAFLAWIAPFVIIASVLYAFLRADPSHPSMPAALALLVVSCLGIYIFVRLMLIGPIATAEEIGPLQILRRSWDLTAGNWWRLFGFFLVFAIGTLILVRAVGSVIGLLAAVSIGVPRAVNVSFLIVVIVVQLISSAMYVILFVMETRLYAQRSEGAGHHPSVPTTGI